MAPNYSSRLVPSAKFYQESDLLDRLLELDKNPSHVVTNISLTKTNINTVYEFK